MIRLFAAPIFRECERVVVPVEALQRVGMQRLVMWIAWFDLHQRRCLFNGALKFELISRLELNGDKVVKEERLLQGLHERIRDVRQGPDGALYLLTDNADGRILRVAPAR